MASRDPETYYDVLGLPRNSESRHIRTQLLNFTNTDLSELTLESVKQIVAENHLVVKAYEILINKTTREAYDKTLPDLNAHCTDDSTEVKDWAQEPTRTISTSKQRHIRRKSEKMVQEVIDTQSAKEIKDLQGWIQRGERSLREWRRLEIQRLKDLRPFYLGHLSRRSLEGMARLSLNREKVRQEIEDRERHLLLSERLKLLLRALELDLDRIREDRRNAL